VNLDVPLEGAAADFHLVVAAVAIARPAALAGDHERAVLQHDLHLLGIDSGKLDDDHELRRILGAVAIDGWPKAVLARAERTVPELGDEATELVAGFLRRIAALALAHVFVLPPNADYASVPIQKPSEIGPTTLIRAVLVPSLTAMFGRYKWWLPLPLARIVRVEPSLLAPCEQFAPAEE
jgi:hypothetical protein